MKIFKIAVFSTILLFSVYASAQDPHAKSGLKMVTVQEVIQVSSYTYLNVLEGDTKKWIAVPTIEAKVGETFYYNGGMEMPQFKSAELDRTFDSVLFVGTITSAEAINLDKGIVSPDAEKSAPAPAPTGKKPTLDKLELNINAIDGGIRIAELFENKQQYVGKKVKIIGEVTKFTLAIMGKNWVHFQDGTSFDDAYDLMITSKEEIILVGDVVVFEGVIALNKDFGAGYFYKIIMEDAVLVK